MTEPDESAEQQVYVRDANGNLLQGPASELGEALKAGATQVSPEEVEQNQLQTKYGDLGGEVATAGLGAFDALTFGASSGILGELGGEKVKENIRGLQAANPWSYGLGTLGGALIPALATGGESLAEEAPLMERVLGGVGREALSGAAYGAGSQISEDVINDTDTTAEKLIAAIGHGALIGGAAGGIFEGLGGLKSSAFDRMRLRSQDIDSIAEKEFGQAAPGVGRAVKMYANLSARVSGADQGAIESALSPANRELRKLLADDGESFLDEAARGIRTAGDEMLSADKLVSAEARGDIKASYVQKAVKRGNEAETKAWALKEIDGLIGGAQETLDNGGGYTKAIEHASTAAYRAKAAIGDAGDNAEVFTSLDNMKRDLQKLTRNSWQTLTRMQDPIDQRAARMTTEWLDKSAERFRSGLEDEGLWGKAAEDQKTINAAWSKQIDASKRFHAALTTEIGRDPTNPYLQVRGIDPGKASSYVRGIVNPDKDLTHTAVRDYIESTKDLAGAIQKSYELPAQSLEEVGRVNRAAGALSDHIYKAEKGLQFINQFRALRKSSRSGSLGTVGAVVGGPVGAAIGVAHDVLGDPAKTVERLAGIERLHDKVTQHIRGVGDTFEGKPKLVSPPSLKATTSRESFEASAKNVRELATNPDALNHNLGRSLAAIASAAPKVATAVSMRSQAMIKYLADNLPPGMTPQDGVLNTKWFKPIYSDSEMRDWQQLASALHDPVGTLNAGIKSGSMSLKAVGAIKQFYPKIFGEIISELEQRISEMKDPPPREKRLSLASLFDMPTDVDLDQGVMSVLDGMYTTPSAPPDGAPTGRSGPKNMSVDMASGVRTPGQEVEDGRKD